MANATSIVKKGIIDWDQPGMKRSAETLSAETTFYKHAMIGIDSTGYYCKFDDAQSAIFAGVVRGDGGNPVLPAGTAGDGTIDLDILRPRYMELAVSGVAVTSINKKVYASDDQTGVLSNSSLTYANFIGHVVDVIASGIALVELCYDGLAGHSRYNVSKFLAATGTQTLSRLDLNKTIFCPNTAAHTVNLPPASDTQAGDRFTFVKTTSDAQAVTLDADSGELIDAATTLATIDAQYDTAILVSTGAAWIVLARDIA